jgi:hypothetical protein
LAIDRKHDEEDFVAEEPVLEVAVNRKDSGVVEGRIVGALLEIDGEQVELVLVGGVLAGAAEEVEDLEKLPAVLVPVAIVGEDGVKEIEFAEASLCVFEVGEERRDGPEGFGWCVLLMEKWAEDFGAVARAKGEVEVVEEGAGVEFRSGGKDGEYCRKKSEELPN